eukprot:TRINITY_DN11504_c0_g2_i8.p1 TRINITY_DN11504_c0_g2~~TRINITY_DN11504_c0_g2_i8.p1  ORF type:complete len:535 (-),score=119.13 TRINITY_DN11504_c0_g2_i8:111-1715(-)
MPITEAEILDWACVIIRHGLTLKDRMESVREYVPEDFEKDQEKYRKIDAFCDGRALVAFSFAAAPELAEGRVGLAVFPKIAFFQRFCRELGVPEAHLCNAPDLWPRPAKRPKRLLRCLLEVAAELRAEDPSLPKLQAPPPTPRTGPDAEPKTDAKAPAPSLAEEPPKPQSGGYVVDAPAVQAPKAVDASPAPINEADAPAVVALTEEDVTVEDKLAPERAPEQPPEGDAPSAGLPAEVVSATTSLKKEPPQGSTPISEPVSQNKAPPAPPTEAFQPSASKQEAADTEEDTTNTAATAETAAAASPPPADSGPVCETVVVDSPTTTEGLEEAELTVSPVARPSVATVKTEDTISDSGDEDEVSELYHGASEIFLPPPDAPMYNAQITADLNKKLDLPVLSGYLWKKSPSKKRAFAAQLGLTRQWDKRFFALRDMKLVWWENEAHAMLKREPKGAIDLHTEAVCLERLKNAQPGEPAQLFVIRPAKETGWKSNKRAKRIYTLDSQGSEYTRDEWMLALSAHIAHGDSWRKSVMLKK